MLDLYKALFALGAGDVLGLERELKDKSAGLKTISVICLGSALFSILSFKIGSPFNEPTRIASYIVSGVGFIGAGVIFKDGLNVSGLTTAGIIWLAAAVGTAIGFGEFFLALTFMCTSLLIVFTSSSINKVFRPRKQNRTVVFRMLKDNEAMRGKVIKDLTDGGILLEEKRLEDTGTKISITFEAVIKLKDMKWFQDYMLKSDLVDSFVI